jgi:hypothetical protein
MRCAEQFRGMSKGEASCAVSPGCDGDGGTHSFLGKFLATKSFAG